MKTEERKSMHEIIDETVEFYSNNPRSIKEGRCLYRGPDGEQCAYARMITNPEVLTEGMSCDFGVNLIANVKFKPEYAGYDISFYAGVQRLHDFTKYWGVAGLSDKGKEYVTDLKQQFNG